MADKLVNTSGNADDETVLNFDVAMSHFTNMFPHIPPIEIETALRKNNGDVTSTIDDLLQYQNLELNCSEGETQHNQRLNRRNPNNPNFQATNKGSQSTPSGDSCQNDEKIALLIQNREFLKYLRSDPSFMREVYGSRTRCHRRYKNYPMLLASSPAIFSRNNRKFEQIEYGIPVRSDSPPPLVPDGPIVNIKNKGSIPSGPLIDYTEPDNSKWTKKLKSHLPFASSSKSSFAHKPMVEDEDGDDEGIKRIYLDDRHFASKLLNLSRNSKSLLHSLAKKFSISNGNAHLASKPMTFIETEPPPELSYDQKNTTSTI